MIEAIVFVLGTAITTGAAGFGYLGTRRFVRDRLRFVDEIQKPRAPVVVGAVATLATMPLTLLPLISGVTVVAFGVAVGAGTRAGARQVRRLTGGY